MVSGTLPRIGYWEAFEFVSRLLTHQRLSARRKKEKAFLYNFYVFYDQGGSACIRAHKNHTAAGWLAVTRHQRLYAVKENAREQPQHLHHIETLIQSYHDSNDINAWPVRRPWRLSSAAAVRHDRVIGAWHMPALTRQIEISLLNTAQPCRQH